MRKEVSRREGRGIKEGRVSVKTESENERKSVTEKPGLITYQFLDIR